MRPASGITSLDPGGRSLRRFTEGGRLRPSVTPVPIESLRAGPSERGKYMKQYLGNLKRVRCKVVCDEGRPCRRLHWQLIFNKVRYLNPLAGSSEIPSSPLGSWGFAPGRSLSLAWPFGAGAGAPAGCFAPGWPPPPGGVHVCTWRLGPWASVSLGVLPVVASWSRPIIKRPAAEPAARRGALRQRPWIYGICQ
jgi:hypothetical protein